MIESIDTSLIDWSRAQFAMTAMYHWIFVPLTLGLAVVMGIMETLYYKTGNEFWKRTAKFWMKLFGINFAIGVATGLILEFEFGTNWSNYSWFVGDIFGAPLAIEGILAFFMEATFIAVMFFGWEKVSKRFHLASTWLTGLAVNKFFHTVLSGWVLGGVFVVGIGCWYLLKKRNREFALASIKIGAIFGLVASLLSVWTGDGSGYQIAQTQPMKLAAVEGLYEGGTNVGLVGIGMLNPEKKTYNDGKEPFLFRIEIPSMLSFLAERDANAYVPGITNIIEGGYQQKDGTIALSAAEKIERGKTAIGALAAYRAAKSAGNEEDAQVAYKVLQENIPYFGYGYIKDVNQLVPNVPLNFYAFRVMVVLGGYFILFFIVVLFFIYKKDLSKMRWMHWVALLTIPLAYIAGQAGWVVAECGRQPWAIRDLLPTSAAISKLDVGSVQTTFFIFLFLFTVMLIAEIGIMIRAIKKGPEV